jgi:hypothetical protein
MADYKFGVNIKPHERWPVAWYNPVVLFEAAREMVSSFDMIRNADPREQFADTLKPIIGNSLGVDGEGEVLPFDTDGEGEFWFDFISDVGDGGNATFTVARAALSDDLTVADPAGGASGQLTTPRGRLLVLGGDLAYPGAKQAEYRFRFMEVYEGARSRTGNQQQDYSAVAIAQNHDWFDSTSSFRRMFVNRNKGEFIGADTPQDATYFAAKLPQGWWLLGFDFALVGDLDRGQFEAFSRLIGSAGTACEEGRLQTGDQVILLYPEPYWYRPLGDGAGENYPKRYQRLEAKLESAGIRVRVRLAGDCHHYVRQWTDDPEPTAADLLLTCGSGGAFLHPTHSQSVHGPKRHELVSQPLAIAEELRHAVHVGTVEQAGSANIAGRVTYPDQATSKALCWENVTALFKFGSNDFCPSLKGLISGNIMFALLLGGVYWLAAYTNSLPFSAAFVGDGFVPAEAVHELGWGQLLFMWGHGLFFSPLALGVHLVLGTLCVAIANEESSLWLKVVVPIAHFLVHVFATATLFWLGAKLVNPLCAGPDGSGCLAGLWPFGRGLLHGLIVFVAGTGVGGLIFGSYFALMSFLGYMPNNAYSAIACEDYKGFLRFKIDRAGKLHGYFYGCDKVPRHWQTQPPPSAQAAGDVRPAWKEADGGEAARWRLVDRFELSK